MTGRYRTSRLNGTFARMFDTGGTDFLTAGVPPRGERLRGGSCVAGAGAQGRQNRPCRDPGHARRHRDPAPVAQSPVRPVHTQAAPAGAPAPALRGGRAHRRPGRGGDRAHRRGSRPSSRPRPDAGLRLPAFLCDAHPVRTLLSGPAGGVVGAVGVARAAGLDDIIAMDMGGTRPDSTEGRVGAYPVQVPHRPGGPGRAQGRSVRARIRTASAG